MANEPNAALKISLGISVGFFILLFGNYLLRCAIKRKKYRTPLKQDFTCKVCHEGSLRLFTSEKLKKATNDFNGSQQISEGIYRGILWDKTVVAIKKLDEQHVFLADKYCEEVNALSQINHRNAVRPLGCCLEGTTSFLVYEFFSNKGTLYEHIHKIRMRGSSPFSLYWRIKAAAETAAALAYIHSKSVLMPQKVNTMNILFDDNYMVKLLLGPEFLRYEDELMNSVQERMGVMGHREPEYFPSPTLTDKSNVHSFGVVLAELLTSRKAFDYERPEAERVLAKAFAREVEGRTLHQILDEDILKEGNSDMVEKVADLAIRCLRNAGADRPSMKQVAMELEGLRIMAKHPRGMLNFSESLQKTTDPIVDAVRSVGFQGGPSSVITNAEAMGSRRLQEADYYLT
ncbi:hypothetical protein M0R45_037099 [Rubus argutus]|uniref:Protein kinase domain-containing protein n=1 Tax=Rubus argutus TaxID=59490 RepID=A0AAW1VZC7_RUBAR